MGLVLTPPCHLTPFLGRAAATRRFQNPTNLNQKSAKIRGVIKARETRRVWCRFISLFWEYRSLDARLVCFLCGWWHVNGSIDVCYWCTDDFPLRPRLWQKHSGAVRLTVDGWITILPPTERREARRRGKNQIIIDIHVWACVYLCAE